MVPRVRQAQRERDGLVLVEKDRGFFMEKLVSAEAKRVAQDGRRSVIANGRAQDVILRVAKGQRVGTVFI